MGVRTGVADTWEWSNLIESSSITNYHLPPRFAGQRFNLNLNFTPQPRSPNLSSSEISTSVLLYIKGTHLSVQPLHNNASVPCRVDSASPPH